MGDIVVYLGGFIIILGAWSAFGIGEEKGALKTCLAKVLGGAVIIGIGIVMRQFSV